MPDAPPEIPAELVHLSVTGAVATITLDSQHNRNALSRQLVTELFEHLETAAADPAVRVVLVQAAGRVFCSGADLAEATGEGMEQGTRRGPRRSRRPVPRPARAPPGPPDRRRRSRGARTAR